MNLLPNINLRLSGNKNRVGTIRHIRWSSLLRLFVNIMEPILVFFREYFQQKENEYLRKGEETESKYLTRIRLLLP